MGARTETPHTATAPHPAAPSFRPGVGVHLILIRDGLVLLGLRQNTGFADGMWSVPGGRLEADEPLPAAIAREAAEELGITISPEDLTLACVCHHNDPDEARIGMFFTAQYWQGEPSNAEPDKCAKIAWFRLDDLPNDIVGYTAAAIKAYERGDALVTCGWR